MDATLRLGIGNGSLLKPVAWCLEELGIPCDTETRLTWQYTGHQLIGGIFMSRPQHVVTALQQGIINCAIIGKDMLYEHSQSDEFVICAELGMSKTGFANPGWVVLFRRQDQDSAITDLFDIRPDTTLVSEYPRLTAHYLEVKDIQANIIQSSGGTEHAVAAGLYDLGVGITETGKSLYANNLLIMDCLLEAKVVLCVPAGDPCVKTARYLGELLQGTLKLRQYV